ncbi:MAG: UDP-N-acetylglucosamine 1-carboxyvinyltransferase [Candidatus Parcubacteria bacterium]|nr:MAG: UDP-N-acetylglucosamine 1-carboxyvinyltransferase [Candidatus Parcubacteria bacterium]
MEKIIIKGGQKLSGEIKIAGSKNTALPLIASTILIEGRVILKNVPKIRDVDSMLKILEYLGAEISFTNSDLIINTKNISYRDLLIDEIKKLRASILFMGPMLAKFKKIKIFFPGGDIIGARSIDAHLKALEDLGCKFKIYDQIIEGSFEKFSNNVVILKEVSVTASENLIMFCCYANKDIKLRLVAIEPHIRNLCLFLKKAGFDIKGIGTHFLTVKKDKRIKNEIIFKIPPDDIETATFLSLGLATKSRIKIINNNLDNLDALLITLKEMGADFEIEKNNFITKPSKLKGAKIQTGLYPKLASDFHPPLGVLATQAEGVTLIHEWLYENRFGYLRELENMGANIDILDPHRAIIIGPTPLVGKEIKALDIRAGAALIIAASIANGTSVIYDFQIIERGYENIVQRLNNLGLDIKSDNYHP